MIDADQAPEEVVECNPRRGTHSVTRTSSSSPDGAASMRDRHASSPQGRDGVLEVRRRRRRRRVEIVDLEPRRLACGALGKRDANRGRLARGANRATTEIDVVVGDRVVARASSSERRHRAGSRRRRGRRARRGGRDRVHPGLGRQPARGRPGRSGRDRPSSGRCSRRTRGSRTHERPGRARRWPRRGHGARLGARRGGDALLGHERGRRRGSDARRGRRDRPLPGGDLRVRLEGGRATLTGTAESQSR